MKNLYLAAAAGLGVFAAAPSAAAPVITCSTGIGNGGASAINLVTDGCISQSGDGFYSNANGGDPEAKVEQAIFHATGNTVELSLYGVKSDDDDAGDFFTFDPVDPATALSGTWSINDSQIFVKYMTVKAANSFALFEFAGVGANSGDFSTLGILNNGGQRPTVSHISFWNPTRVVPNNPDAVPEPATWALMLGGFGLVGSAMRRRKLNTTVTYA